MTTQYRQGDVFIERVKALPKGLAQRARDKGRIVLAYGEVTGHAHALDESLAELFEDKAGVLYLRLGETGHVRHEEHGAITLEPGMYRVTHQREYSPEDNRRVAD
jgi:hypothetical protein